MNNDADLLAIAELGVTTNLLHFPAALAQRLANQDLRFIITGASGWLGLVTLEMLKSCLGEGFTRRVVCFGSASRRLTLRDGSSIEQRPLHAMADLEHSPSILFHYAFLTRDKVANMPLDDYVCRNRAISDFVAQEIGRCGAISMVLTSSGAVYGPQRELASNISTNPYGVLKAEDEKKFARLAETHSFGLIVPRVFNIAGAYTNKPETYVMASLVADVLAGRPCCLRATKHVYRAYTSVAQLVALFAAVASTEKFTEVIQFDTTGTEVLEVGALASRVTEVLGASAEIRRPPLHDSESDTYVGEGPLYASLCARHDIPSVSLELQIRDTALFMAASH